MQLRQPIKILPKQKHYKMGKKTPEKLVFHNKTSH